MVEILMMSAKLAALDYLKIKVFSKKGYDVIIHAHGFTNKVSLCDENYTVDTVM